MRRLFFFGLFVFLIPVLPKAQTLMKDVIHAFGLYESGQYEEAVTAFDKVIDNYSGYDQKSTLYRGMAFFHLKAYQAAESDLRKSAGEGDPEAFLWLARLYVLTGSYTEAVNAIEKYITESGHPDVSDIKKDTLFRKLHNTQEWFALWQKELLSEEGAVQEDVSYYLGKNDFAEAHGLVETKLGSGPDDAWLYGLNSEIYARENIYQLAVNDINKAITLQPENVRFWKLKAEYLVALGKYREATGMFSKILDASPEDFDSRFRRAETAYYSEDYDLAESDNQLYLSYFNTPGAVFLMGQILYAKGAYVDALKYINKIIHDEEPMARYLSLRGMIYYQTETYQYASQDLSMSLDLEPRDKQTNLYLGLAEYHLGNRNLCCYYLKRAKEFGELAAIEYLRKYCE